MNSIDSYGSSGSGGGMEEDYANEPPLLEELGVHFDHIAVKTKAVILPFSRFQSNNHHHNNNAILDPVEICKEADLAGPLAFGLLLGAEMVLMGKLQFGVIYGFGMFGCVSMTLIVNLMSPTEPISIWTVTSVLGYGLLPVNGLALVKVFFMNQYTGINFVTLGRILALVTVAWSTTASTRLLEVGCGLRDQRYLIAYPVALLYCAFVLITIF
jgi:protein YIPF5/7